MKTDLFQFGIIKEIKILCDKPKIRDIHVCIYVYIVLKEVALKCINNVHSG